MVVDAEMGKMRIHSRWILAGGKWLTWIGR